MVSIFIIVAVVVLFVFVAVNSKILGPSDHSYSLSNRYWPGIYSKIFKTDRDVHRKNLFIADDIFKKYGIEYNLSEGTALGSIREHDIIEGDTDVDLELDVNDIEKFKNTIKDFKDEGFTIMRWWIDTNLNGRVINFVSIVRNSHYIDFQFSGEGLHCITLEDNPPHLCDDFLPIKTPYQEGTIGDRKFRTPSMKYIELLYGPTWKTPRKGFKPNTEVRDEDGKLK